MSFTTKTRSLYIFGASGNANLSIIPVGNNEFTIEALNAAGTAQLPITFNTTDLNFTKTNGTHYNINSRLNDLETDVSTESGRVDALISADAVLQANINTNTTAINTEVSARVAACSTLTTNTSSNASGLASEITRALAAESTLTSSVATHTTNISTLTAGLSTANINIASEITNREAAITTEIAARDAAILVETTARAAAVSAEATTRAAAVSALQTSVNNLLSNSDPAVIDSFTEALQAWTTSGNTLQTNINTLTTATASDVSGINTRLNAIEAMLEALQGV